MGDMVEWGYAKITFRIYHYIGALGWFVLLDVFGGVTGAALDISGKANFPTWLWISLLGIAAIVVPFIAFHKVRVQRDKALGAEQSLILTPHAYAIGLSGMTGYPNEPVNAAWLLLEVSVNAIGKPIDTLDLIIDGQTTPANHWPSKNVTAFNAYFNVTEWRWKGKNQVELMAHVGDKMHRSGRIHIDFNVEPWGSHRI